MLGIKYAGGSHAYVSKKIKEYGIDTSHFTGQAHGKGKTSPKKLSWSEVLVYDRHGGRKQHTYMLRTAMMEYGTVYECAECNKPPVWNSKPLVLEVDHIDGNSVNDLPDNLRFLCPDCHSQQITSNKPHKYR